MISGLKHIHKILLFILKYRYKITHFVAEQKVRSIFGRFLNVNLNFGSVNICTKLKNRKQFI